MNDALNAIKDIKKAIIDYGSDITLNKIVAGTYNPQTGTTSNGTTSYPMKAIVKSQATEKSQNALEYVSRIENSISAYTLSVLLYHTEEPKKDWKVIYKGNTYTILYVSPTVLQNSNLIYELLIKK